MSARQMIGATVVALLVAVAPAGLRSAGPSFRPDTTFSASTLEGWHPLGSAEWRAEGGALVGTPGPGGGGWLVLDRSLQDVGFFASFRCGRDARPACCLRAEKTSGGMKGVYVALTKATSRRTASRSTSKAGSFNARVRTGGGQIRIAPPARSKHCHPGARLRARGTGPAVTLPVDAARHEPESRRVEHD